MLIFWIFVFVVSLVVLVKGADWLIASAEKIGLSLGLSPFIVGVTIVGIGTSFPELISSFFAVIEGATDVPVANAVGSNIANIFLIVGISAVIGKKLVVTKNLIDLDIPLLAASTALFLGTAYDGVITRGESVLLLAAFAGYFIYTLLDKEEFAGSESLLEPEVRKKVVLKDFILLIVGIVALIFGAKYLVESLVNLSIILNIATGVIAITAVAIGTSLPELLVSLKALLQKKSEVALGNIFGSNVFNILVVVGIPGLFQTLTIDPQSFSIGLPALIVATLLFTISGISKKIHLWEGLFFLFLYVLFIGKLFAWF
ncbi:MAG TPA: calcium/sodium antiporter [Candidatus Paceibacterota bacterium]|nr:calcium/sodium antiporter [Candidatus Paceibacterota bacterium]